MKKILLSLGCLAVSTFAFAQLIPKQQMQVTNATQNATYLSSEIDNAGVVYALGYASPNTDINPGSGILSSGSINSYFITKYDPATQNLLWAVTYTTSGFSSGLQSLDINSLGEVICVGGVNNTFDLDPTGATSFITNGANTQAVMLKFSTTGTYLGYKQLNSSGGYSKHNTVYIDASDNIYIAGGSVNTINFDFGATNYTLTAASTGGDYYMACYNSNLSFNWATLLGTVGNINPVNIRNIQTDGLGNTYATCKASGSATIAGTALINSNEFVVKRNSSGVISDCFLFDITAPFGNVNLKLNVFSNGKFYISGGFYGTVDFDPTAGLLSKTSYTFGTASDQFVGFYNANGSPIWLHTFSNYIGEVFYASGTDSQKHIFLWGNYENVTDYDLGSGTAIFPNTNPLPQYMIVGYDSLGAYIGGRTFMTGIDPNYTAQLKVFSSGAGIMFMGNSGGFGSTVDYAPGPPVMNLNATGSTNGFITTYDFCLSSFQSTVTPSICSGSTYTLPTGSTVTATGTYTSPLKSYWGCDSMIFTNLTVNPLPTITASTNNTLICVGQSANISASGATSYTWNTTATSSSITVTPTINTTYSVTGTDVNGCENSTTVVQIVSTCTGIDNSQIGIHNSSIILYPNPTQDILHVSIVNSNETTSVEIINMLGEIVFQSKLNTNDAIFNIENLTGGVYFLRVKQDNNYQQVKFIKQ